MRSWVSSSDTTSGSNRPRSIVGLSCTKAAMTSFRSCWQIRVASSSSAVPIRDLDLDLAGFFVESDVTAVGIVPTLPVIEAWRRAGHLGSWG